MISCPCRQGIYANAFHWKQVENLIFPEPRRFCSIPHCQAVAFGHLPEHGRYYQLLRWLALVQYWNQVQQVIVSSNTERVKIELLVEQAEAEHPEWVPDILSPWNRKGWNQWNYIPSSYPLTVFQSFAIVRVAPNPRYPWVEKTGVYKHDQ